MTEEDIKKLGKKLLKALDKQDIQTCFGALGLCFMHLAGCCGVSKEDFFMMMVDIAKHYRGPHKERPPEEQIHFGPGPEPVKK